MAPIRCSSTHKRAGTIDTGDNRAHSEPIFPVEGVLRAGLHPTKPTDIPHAFRRTFFSLSLIRSPFLCPCVLCHTRLVALRGTPSNAAAPLTRRRVPLVPCFKPRHRRVVQGSLALSYTYYNAAYDENSAACSPHRRHHRAYRCCRWSDRATA